MTIKLTATKALLNGNPVNTDMQAFALMLKAKLLEVKR